VAIHIEAGDAILRSELNRVGSYRWCHLQWPPHDLMIYSNKDEDTAAHVLLQPMTGTP
jgi:hypothetical protein